MACAQKSKLPRGFGEGFLLAKCGVRPLGLWLYSDWLVVRPQGGAPGISPSALSYHPPPARGLVPAEELKGILLACARGLENVF